MYHNLGPDQVDNYDVLKAAFVRHYELSTGVAVLGMVEISVIPVTPALGF